MVYDLQHFECDKRSENQTEEGGSAGLLAKRRRAYELAVIVGSSASSTAPESRVSTPATYPAALPMVHTCAVLQLGFSRWPFSIPAETGSAHKALQVGRDEVLVCRFVGQDEKPGKRLPVHRTVAPG